MNVPLFQPRSPTKRDLLFMGNPKLWPHWPYLPIIRYLPGDDIDCGVMFDCCGLAGIYGYSATVFLCNLLTMPANQEEFLQLPKEVFDSVEEMIAAGWVVD